MTAKLFLKSLRKSVLMKRFEFFEHTADVSAKIWGKNERELFSNALLCVFSLAKPSLDSQMVERKISVSANNLEELLVDFLNKVIYFSQVFKEAYQKVIFEKFLKSGKKWRLKAKLKGKKIKKFGEDIKAVTYYGLKIEKDKKFGLVGRLTFDI
jgi:SHS2 domain-containing protein